MNRQLREAWEAWLEYAPNNPDCICNTALWVRTGGAIFNRECPVHGVSK